MTIMINDDLLLPSDDQSPSMKKLNLDSIRKNLEKENLRYSNDTKDKPLDPMNTGNTTYRTFIVDNSKTSRELVEQLGTNNLLSLFSETSPIKNQGFELTASNRAALSKNYPSLNVVQTPLKKQNVSKPLMHASPLRPRPSLTGQHAAPYRSQRYRNENLIKDPKFSPIENRRRVVREGSSMSFREIIQIAKYHATSPLAIRLLKVASIIIGCIMLGFMLFAMIVLAMRFTRAANNMKARVIM